MSTPPSNQAVITVASDHFAERLDFTFTSFTKNLGLALHAFIIGDALPARRLPEITYHLVKPDPAFQNPMREMYYRRLLFLDELGVDYALIVDNSDVLCLQPLPPFAGLLGRACFGACVEHNGGRYVAGQGYTSCYFNFGVTFWSVRSSKSLREEIVSRGLTRFRSVEDQLTANEVIQTRYYDQMAILPSQYNFRAHLFKKQRGWPTVNHLDGVVLYHNSACMDEAKKLTHIKPRAILPELEPDTAPLTPLQKFWRRVQNRLSPHQVR